MYGPCLPGHPEPLSGSRSASSPVPPSPENRQGYTPPDTVPAPKNSSPMGHSVSFCILLTPSARPFHLCRTNCFILYKIVWSVERSCNDKFASVFVEFWNTENINMDIVSRIPSTAPKIKTHLPHPPGLGRFSAQDATLFHPSAENTELGTRYDINCSYSSDKIKQILCFPLRPQMSGGIGQQTLPRSAAGKAGQCFSLSISKRNTPPAI